MTGFIESLRISSSDYVNAGLSVAAFLVLAKLADLVVDKVLRRFSKFTASDIDDRIIDLIHKPVGFTIIIVGVVNAVTYLKPDAKLLFYLDGLLYSVLTVIWCLTAIRISNAVIEHSVHRVSDVTGLSKDIIPLIENTLKIVIIAAAIMVGLSLWHVNIAPLVASAGIAGAAVAFAAKDTIANFFGGISVFVDKPFKIGDIVVLDKGERGEVVAIGVRSTRLKTIEDTLITIPNSIIAGSKIINESAPLPNLRVRIAVGVAYGSDIDFVEKALLEVASLNANVNPDPAPRVRFREFGDSSLKFELFCWVREPAMRELAVHELNCAVYKRFNELGIGIPFPQQDVHLYREG